MCSFRIALETFSTSSLLLIAEKRLAIRSISFHPQLFLVSWTMKYSAKASEPGSPDSKSTTRYRNSEVSLVHHASISRRALGNPDFNPNHLGISVQTRVA